GALTTLVASPDGKLGLSGGSDGNAILFELGSGHKLSSLTDTGKSITAAAFDPSGGQIMTISIDGLIRIWDRATGNELMSLKRPNSGMIRAAAFSPDATRLASASWDKTVDLWDLTTGALIASLSGHTDSVEAVAFSPDGRYLVTGSFDNTA